MYAVIYNREIGRALAAEAAINGLLENLKWGTIHADHAGTIVEVLARIEKEIPASIIARLQMDGEIARLRSVVEQMDNRSKYDDSIPFLGGE